MLFAAQPQWLSRVLGVVIRALSTALLKRAGVRHCTGGSPDQELDRCVSHHRSATSLLFTRPTKVHWFLETKAMPAIADRFDFVIGVDPHKHTHTAAFLTVATGNTLTIQTAEASPVGFTTLVAVADTNPGIRCWVIEGCGSWGRGFAAWLMVAGETVWEIESLKRPARRMGKKTDDIDAARAAREALGRESLATPRCTGERDALAARLRGLKTYRIISLCHN
jgi:hypothetical protein